MATPGSIKSGTNEILVIAPEDIGELTLRSRWLVSYLVCSTWNSFGITY